MLPLFSVPVSLHCLAERNGLTMKWHLGLMHVCQGDSTLPTASGSQLVLLVHVKNLISEWLLAVSLSSGVTISALEAPKVRCMRLTF